MKAAHPDQGGDGALAGLTILELAQDISGPWCGKVFADLGADVVKIEPPGGDASRAAGPFVGDARHPEKSGRFLYLNANKRGIVLDLETSRDKTQLLDLIAGADVLLVDAPPARLDALDLRWETLRKVAPALVFTCISPFGQTGPYRDYAGNDLIAFHAGGLGRETPYNQVTDLAAEPPLVGGGRQADFMTGWTAAAGTLAALSWREQSGEGQQVDVSAMEAVANMLRISLAGVIYTGRTPIQRLKNGFSWIQPCKDGHVSLSPFGFDHWWERFKTMAGNPDWADMEVFSSMIARLENSDAVELMTNEWLADHEKQEVFQLALEHAVPGFPVHSMSEVLRAEQLRARKFFVDVEHPVAGRVTQPGPPYRSSSRPWPVRTAAPLLGEHTEAVLGAAESARESRERETAANDGKDAAGATRLPLEGIRIIDFGWILAVPHATAWLGALGAEVIRIESQARVDLVRVLPGTAADGEIGLNRAGGFNGISYSKKSVTLNLATAEGVDLAKRLVEKADVVTENFTPGVMERLGIAWDSLKEIKPDLVMLSGSPLGQTGPHRKATGWGPNTQSYAGLPFLTGYQGGPPVGLGGFYPDFMVGVAMAFSIMAALWERSRSGRGQHIDVAMAETVASMIPDALLDYMLNGREPERIGNRHPQQAPQGVYPCNGEDKWAAIAVRSDKEWLALRKALGDPAWARDPELEETGARLRRHDEIDEHLGLWTRQRSHYDVMHALQAVGVPSAPCLDAAELIEDPQMRERGLMVEIDHPEVGRRAVAGLPVRYSEMPSYRYQPAPCIGQHSKEVLRELLDIDGREYEDLVERRIVF